MQISVEIIHTCPNRCLHCSSLSDKTRTLRIETGKVFDIINSAKRMGAEIISISGGEPLLHEGLVEIVQYAKSKGLRTYLYTSGITWDKSGTACAIDEQTLEHLEAAHIDKIIFDLPAIDEQVYDAFMGTIGYQKYALQSIRLCKKMGIFTELHFVPTKINKDQIDNLLAFSRKEHIDMVSFLGLVPHGRALENREVLYLSHSEKECRKEKLNRLEGHDIRVGIPLQTESSNFVCCAGVDKLCIRYDGRVFGCEAFKYVSLFDNNGNAVIPDSIYEKDLEEIYAHSLYLKKEQEFIASQIGCYGDCSHGEMCPVQRMFRKGDIVHQAMPSNKLACKT